MKIWSRYSPYANVGNCFSEDSLNYQGHSGTATAITIHTADLHSIIQTQSADTHSSAIAQCNNLSDNCNTATAKYSQYLDKAPSIFPPFLVETAFWVQLIEGTFFKYSEC